MTKWLAALGLSLGLGFSAAPAEAGDAKIFKDWMGACDNVRTCSAFGFQGGDYEPGYLLIRREAGPEQGPSVSLVVVPADDAPEPRGEAVWRPVVDGEAIEALPTVTAKGDGAYWRADLPPAQASRFIDAIRNGDELILVAGNDQIARYSLAGLTATLLFFDESQGRVGTTSAILRKGDRTAPAAPALPLLRRGPEVDQAGLSRALPRAVAARPEIKACEVAYKDDEELTVARLSPDVVLWAVPCSRGAYNTIFAMLLSDARGGNVRPAVFPHTPGAGQSQSGELMNIQYDPATRILSNFDKARGIGDCGAQSEWVWTGTEFKLVSQYMMPECRGVTLDDWPSMWRAEVR